MQLLLRLASAIDALNEHVGRWVKWLILICVLISTANAVVRKAFDFSSNGFLEIQWYLFSAAFLLGAGYTLKHNQHIRIDILQAKLSVRGQAVVELVGGLLFLLPMAVLMVYLAWPVFLLALHSGEHSSDAGGLIRWPVWGLIPVGFALLILQAMADMIRRVALLAGIETAFAASEEQA